MTDRQTELSEHRTNLSIARSHLSNERTYLSQLRTALSLLSFGITMNRFSIYLQESNRYPTRQHTLLRDSANVGIGMVLLGVIFLIWAYARYRIVFKEIEQTNFKPSRAQALLLTIVTIALGVSSTVWMIMN